MTNRVLPSFVTFRIIIALLACVPVLVFALAVFGLGPAAELIADPVTAVKDWMDTSTTGLFE